MEWNDGGAVATATSVPLDVLVRSGLLRRSWLVVDDTPGSLYDPHYGGCGGGNYGLGLGLGPVSVPFSAAGAAAALRDPDLLHALNAAGVCLLLSRSARSGRGPFGGGRAGFDVLLRALPGDPAVGGPPAYELLEAVPSGGGGGPPPDDSSSGSSRSSPAGSGGGDGAAAGLGEAIHRVFSGGCDLPSIPPGASESATDAPSSSRRRRRDDASSEGPSIELLRGGAGVPPRSYPLAAARLVSDLLGGRCTPSDADGELRDMVRSPGLLLFDPDPSDFPGSGPRFGGPAATHRGRDSEVARLVGAAASDPPPRLGGDGGRRPSAVRCVLLSGAAGSGKSSLARRAADALSADGGWLTSTVKFRRGADHGSLGLVYSLFDGLVSSAADNAAGFADGNAGYGLRVSDAVTRTLDGEAGRILSEALPSLPRLCPALATGGGPRRAGEASTSRLTFLLARLVAAVLSSGGRGALLVADDIQWCEGGALAVLGEVLTLVGRHLADDDDEGGGGGSPSGGSNGRLLYACVYRDDEVGAGHPATVHADALRDSPHVDVVDEIVASSLGRDDISSMLAAELRLPRRIVDRLTAQVYNRTLGHAMFVVQLLNRLVGSGIVSYSPARQRYAWDEDRLARVRTFDSVASVIVSNLTSLDGTEPLKALRVLSCLLGRADLGLLRLLESNGTLSPDGGFETNLPPLVDGGIVEVSSDSSVSFTHDLILQQVYEGMSPEERAGMHLEIGTHLGSVLRLDDREGAALEGIMADLDIESDLLSDLTGQDGGGDRPAEGRWPGSAVLVAVDQVNLAGPEFAIARDPSDPSRFARWNMIAADETTRQSSFQMSANLCKRGIDFLSLGGDPWKDATDEQRRLSRRLHEGAAGSLFALGQLDRSVGYARAVIKNMSFDDSIRAYFLLVRSLIGLSMFSEVIATGVAVFRTMGIDIPDKPTPETLYRKMKRTSELLGRYEAGEIVEMAKTATISSRTRDLLMIQDAVGLASYRQASPYLPIFGCISIQYAIENRAVCAESAVAFVYYGSFLLVISEDFAGARKAAEIARELDGDSFAQMALTGFLNLWFVPHVELCRILRDIYEHGKKVGDIYGARFSLLLHYRFAFYSGSEKLSILTKTYQMTMEKFLKYKTEGQYFIAIDISLVDSLTGCESEPYAALQGSEFPSEESLLSYLKSRKLQQSLVLLYLSRFMRSFWAGDYVEGHKHFELAEELPSFKLPTVQYLHAMFYRGLALFQTYREGNGEDYFEKGKSILETVRRWEPNCKRTFQNKFILLEAEYFASSCNIVASKESYVLSAKIAHDNGLLHEQGLAYELYGKFLKSIVEIDDARRYFLMACNCYSTWGAHAKVSALLVEQELTMADQIEEVIDSVVGDKHGRSGGALM